MAMTRTMSSRMTRLVRCELEGHEGRVLLILPVRIQGLILSVCMYNCTSRDGCDRNGYILRAESL